jgi:hypothetical protein
MPPHEVARRVILEIDHVLVVAADPEAAAADLAAVLGLVPAGGGVHAAIGTRNALLSLAGPYLEFIGLADDAPTTRERALRHPIGAAVVRALDSLAAQRPVPSAKWLEAVPDAEVADFAYVTVPGRTTCRRQAPPKADPARSGSCDSGRRDCPAGRRIPVAPGPPTPLPHRARTRRAERAPRRRGRHILRAISVPAEDPAAVSTLARRVGLPRSTW